MAEDYLRHLQRVRNRSILRTDADAYFDFSLQQKIIELGDDFNFANSGLALLSAFKLAQYAGGANIYGFAASVLWPAVKSLVTPSPPTSITRKFDPAVPEVTVAERQFYEPAAWASRTTSVLEMMEKRMEEIDKALEMHLPKQEAGGVKSEGGPKGMDEVTKPDSLFRLVDLPNDDKINGVISALPAIPPRDLEFLRKFPLLRTERHYGITRKEYEVVEKLLRKPSLWVANEPLKRLKTTVNNSTVMRFARGKYRVYNQ